MAESAENRRTLEYLALCRERLWPERRRILGDELHEKWDNALTACTDREQLYLSFLLASLPVSDLQLCGPELLLNTIRQAEEVRCARYSEPLPERIFLVYLLYPRVFDEELSDCREMFRRELQPRVEGLTPVEAALEVNRWCAEHVAYRSTDDYTDSALSVFLRGYGRCGEESAFAVTALRSVGLAARQVYVPWWSHCDDNHAWVEVYDGVSWRYFGACEPEPDPDRGWFSYTASRAMMVHCHALVAGSRQDWQPALVSHRIDPNRLGEEDGLVCLQLTRRYAWRKTGLVEVLLINTDGDPLPYTAVTARILNMADFRTIAVRETGDDGKTMFSLAEGGSVLISAGNEMGIGEVLVRVPPLAEGTLKIALKLSELSRISNPGSADFRFYAPERPRGNPEGFPSPLTAEQKELRRRMLERCSELRRAWTAAAGERRIPPRNGGALGFAGRESFSLTGDCTLTVSAPREEPLLWEQNFSLSRMDNGGWFPVKLRDIPAGGQESFPLPSGRYRLMTVRRLPNGDQLGRRWNIFLAPGEEKSLAVSFRQASRDDLTDPRLLPEFQLTAPSGEAVRSKRLFEERPFTLLFWLEPGSEPTEHLLNELRDSAEALARTGCGIRFVLDRPEMAKAVLERTALPEASIWEGTPETAAALASVGLDPDRLPLVLLVNCKGESLYTMDGYNVGTGELLVRLLNELK